MLAPFNNVANAASLVPSYNGGLRVKTFVLPLAAAFVLAASGCSPRVAETAATDASAAAGPAIDPVAPGSQERQAARDIEAARLAGVYQECQRRRAGLAPANEAPPMVTGLYEARCPTCSRGWLRTKSETPLRGAPNDDAPQTAILPAESWAYAPEQTDFIIPVRGVVVEPGDGYGLGVCDIVHRISEETEEGITDYNVWRLGRVFGLTYAWDDVESDADPRPVIHWLLDDEQAPLPAGAASRLGQWLRLEGRAGGAGWVRDNMSDGFECYWDRDREDICATAPQEPPSGGPRR